MLPQRHAGRHWPRPLVLRRLREPTGSVRQGRPAVRVDADRPAGSRGRCDRPIALRRRRPFIAYEPIVAQSRRPQRVVVCRSRPLRPRRQIGEIAGMDSLQPDVSPANARGRSPPHSGEGEAAFLRGALRLAGPRFRIGTTIALPPTLRAAAMPPRRREPAHPAWQGSCRLLWPHLERSVCHESPSGPAGCRSICASRTAACPSERCCGSACCR